MNPERSWTTFWQSCQIFVASSNNGFREICTIVWLFSLLEYMHAPSLLFCFVCCFCYGVSYQGVDETPVSITLGEDARVSGFAGWFTADFNGTDANPCPCPVTLSTGPENGYTHWGQQVCLGRVREGGFSWRGGSGAGGARPCPA